MLACVALATVIAAPEAALVTPPLPPAPVRDDGVLRQREPTTLYVNFDGLVLRKGCGNDAKQDCSTLANLFQGYVGPFGGNETQKLAILQAVRKDVADFGIRVVGFRPPDDVDYTMVVYGDLGPQDFAGIAPYIDCGDIWANDTSFSQGFAASNLGSAIILQEAAHTWGLEHVDHQFDILHPFKASAANPQFNDFCYRIVANTELEPIAGVCNAIHTRFCPTGYQNSWQELRYLFGEPIPDTGAPELELTNPLDGSSHVLPVSIPLMGEIRDDNHPQAYTLQILQDGELLFESLTNGLDPLLLNFVSPPEGEYDLTVRILDEAGNSTEDQVAFTVLPEGSALEGADDLDPALEPTGCHIAGVSGAALGVWFPMLPLVARRRRTR